jgi:hypothetical protein
MADEFGLAADTRSELGARFDWAFVVSPNAVRALLGRLAWAHDWVSDPTLVPLFQALPGASFIVNGGYAHKRRRADVGGVRSSARAHHPARQVR